MYTPFIANCNMLCVICNECKWNIKKWDHHCFGPVSLPNCCVFFALSMKHIDPTKEKKAWFWLNWLIVHKIKEFYNGEEL